MKKNCLIKDLPMNFLLEISLEALKEFCADAVAENPGYTDLTLSGFCSRNDWDEYEVQTALYGYREETEEEIRARETQEEKNRIAQAKRDEEEAARNAELAKRVEKIERAELERLKKKYEGMT
jgi:flagellar motility protein MotE (MotC chaperone)